MSIERIGHLIEFEGEDGLKTIVRVTAIQIVAQSDPTGDESFLTVANRTFLVRASLDELRDALTEDHRLTMR